MKNWLMFGTLGLIWGSSFLLIKIGVQEMDAFTLVSLRLGAAAVAFALFFALLRKQLPRDGRTWFLLSITGIVNTTLPFVLITVGEETIDSGLAGVLNGTTPLFSMVIAHFALTDDRISAGKVMGLLTGFMGIVLLATRGIDPRAANPLGGQLAVLVAALCYGGSAVFIRRYLRHVEPVVVAGTSLIIGAMAIIIMTTFVVRPGVLVSTLSTGVLLAMAVLGLVNTFGAYNLYFQLLNDWGATRSTLVTYLIPPVSLTLGVVFGSEHLDWQLLLGAALIVGGVALANLQRRVPAPARAPAD